MFFSRYLLTACFVFFTLVSCSGGSGSPNPTDPGYNPPPQISGPGAQSGQLSGTVCWGVWEVFIDEYFGEIEIVPVRGASFEANVVNFLQPPSAPIHLLTIQLDPVGTVLAEGTVACNVAIKHPFPGTKFCGFDVLGIVMGDHEGFPLASNPAIVSEQLPNVILENADGYTRWWNETEFTTYGTLLGYIDGAKANTMWTSTHTLNPFKYFSDDLGPFDAFNPDPELRGFYSSIDPGLNKRRYELQFPVDSGPVFHFKYAISASWVAPYDGAEAPYYPDDYPLEANMPEAYKIGLVDTISNAFYQSESIYGGDLNLFIEVRDWQIQGDLSVVADEIAVVRLESPTLFPDPIELDLSGVMQAPGNPGAIWIPANIEDVTPTGTNNQLIIVTVESGNINTYEPQIPGITGFEFPDGALAAYNILVAPIKNTAPGVIAPVADASATYPIEGDAPLDVLLDPSFSYDPDGWLIQYEWDFEGDGVYDVSTVGPDIVQHTFYSYQNHVVLRVTDNDLASDTDEILITTTFGDEGWRMYRSNFARDGRAQVPGPNTNNLKFELDLGFAGGEIHGGVAIDSQHRIFLRSNDEYLYCISPNGVVIWDYFVGGTWCDSSPSVGVNDSVFVGSAGGTLWHIDKDGELIWSMESEWGRQEAGIAFQVDETIIYGTQAGYIVKVDPDGNELWHYDAGGTHIHGGPAVGPDGRIYFANDSMNITALDQDGNEIWVTSVNAKMNAVPVLGPGGIYIGDNSGNFYCLDYDGSINWEVNLGEEFWNVPSLSAQHKIYIGGDDGTLFCLNAFTGATEWTYDLHGSCSLGSSVVDSLGRVYIGDTAGFFYCIDSTGNLVWEFEGSDGFRCKSPAIDDDGTVIVGNDADIVYAFHD